MSVEFVDKENALDDASLSPKEKALFLIRQIAKNERFKQDAAFFCGYPTELPNEDLMLACNHYADEAEAGSVSRETRETLLSELEKAAAAKPEVKARDNMMSNAEAIELLLKDRSVL